MTNQLINAELKTDIKHIQANINALEPSLTIEKPRSLLLSAYYYPQKDVRRTSKNCP
jgi:hypothetical protein